MPVQVPQVSVAAKSPFRTPSYEKPDIAGAMKQGQVGAKLAQQRVVEDAIQSSLGARALKGSEAALNELAQMPGGGMEAAVTLRGIASANNKAATDAAQLAIVNRGRKFAAIRSETDPKKRRKLYQQYAINNLAETGDREDSQEMMENSNLEDIDMMDSELDYGIRLAAAADKYLQDYQTQLYGDVKKIREETRGTIDKSMTALNTKITDINTAWEKVDSLVDAAKGVGEPIDPKTGKGKPNRTAISSVLVGLVKLQDPNSAVLQGEMFNAINEQDPWAAVTKLLLGKGSSQETIDAVLAKIDPLNPDNIDPAAIRSTASALMKANIRPMQMDYQNNLIQAQGLSKLGGADAIRGNFGQRLFDMNAKFNTSQEDYNSQRLTYNEINQQREMLGLEPIGIPDDFGFKEDTPVGQPYRVVPPQDAIDELRANDTPENRQFFIKTFGSLPEGFK